MPVATKKGKKGAVKPSKQIATPSTVRHSTLSQWGNSLGVRIPREAVEQLQLRAGEQVQMEVGENFIIIRTERVRRKWTADELFKNVKPHRAREFPWGDSVGRERL
jgi:antitoxin MazE